MMCVESLAPTLEQFSGSQLVVVDNGSRDNLVESLSTQLCTSETLAAVRGRVRMIYLPENGGFAGGNNAALRPALASPEPPEYVWLLNSDTVVRPHALHALIAAMESNLRVGIAGSRMEYKDGTPQRSAFRFPTIAGEWEANIRWSWMTCVCARAVIAPPPPSVNTRMDWVSGASMLVRRAVFEQIGLLDESFFMYFEDVDYSHRAAKAGWETWYIPASRVEHQIGGTSGLNSALRKQGPMPRYWFDARHRYFSRYHGRVYVGCADAAWLLGFGIRRIRRFLQVKPNTDPPHLWRDFFLYSIGQKGTRE